MTIQELEKLTGRKYRTKSYWTKDADDTPGDSKVYMLYDAVSKENVCMVIHVSNVAEFDVTGEGVLSNMMLNRLTGGGV